MELLLAILLYVLGCVCLISVASIFSLAVTFVQAASVLILFSIVVAIVKNF